MENPLTLLRETDTMTSLPCFPWFPYKKLQMLANDSVRKPTTGRPTLPINVDFHHYWPALPAPCHYLTQNTTAKYKSTFYKTCSVEWLSNLHSSLNYPHIIIMTKNRNFFFSQRNIFSGTRKKTECICRPLKNTEFQIWRK